MIKQNFTQYCKVNKYPCDLDMMFEAQYNGGLGLAGRVSKRTIKRVEETASNNRALNLKAHEEYCQAILSDEVIDPSGEVTKEDLLARQKARETAVIDGKRLQLTRQISFIKSLGRMSHKEDGTLRAPYQKTVDIYEAELASL